MEANRKIEAVFFDLDGTLLPMEQDFFIKQYFRLISEYLAPYGIESKALIGAILKGTESMIRNNGENTNDVVFWETFFEIMGDDKKYLMPLLDEFYFGDFKRLQEYTGKSKAVQAIETAAKGGKKVVLATNPVFPMSAQLERMSWLGLSEDKFCLVTSYENSHFCKPNPKYYLEICQKIGVSPQNCLMIGNDESDDMKGSMAAGIEGFLLLDHVIKAKDFEWTGLSGSFDDMLNMLERI